MSRLRLACMTGILAASLVAAGCGKDLADQQVDDVNKAVCDMAEAGGTTLAGC